MGRAKKVDAKMAVQIYQVAKRVYQGTLKQADAVRILVAGGMSHGYANVHLTAFKKMMGGELYGYIISSDTTDYFLEQIYQDYGCDFLRKALVALKAHYEYEEVRAKNGFMLYGPSMKNMPGYCPQPGRKDRVAQ